MKLLAFCLLFSTSNREYTTRHLIYPSQGCGFVIRRSRPAFDTSRLPRPKLNISRPPRPKYGISRLCGLRQCIRDRLDPRKVNCNQLDRRKFNRDRRLVSRNRRDRRKVNSDRRKINLNRRDRRKRNSNGGKLIGEMCFERI